ncbi:unnamed protein product [Malus baccata var. baccata]
MVVGVMLFPVIRWKVEPDPEPNQSDPVQNPLGFPKPRMGEKKKKATLFIRLISAAGTGFFYVKKKPSRVQEKLEFRKFDPRSLRKSGMYT